jgi:hypothetical protein
MRDYFSTRHGEGDGCRSISMTGWAGKRAVESQTRRYNQRNLEKQRVLANRKEKRRECETARGFRLEKRDFRLPALRFRSVKRSRRWKKLASRFAARCVRPVKQSFRLANRCRRLAERHVRFVPHCFHADGRGFRLCGRIQRFSQLPKAAPALCKPPHKNPASFISA